MSEINEPKDRSSIMDGNILNFGTAAARARLYTVLATALDGITDERSRARAAASIFEKSVVDESILCWAADHFEKAGGEARDAYAYAIALACASRAAIGAPASFADPRKELGDKSLREIVTSITCEVTRDEALEALLAAYAAVHNACAYGTVLAVYGKPVDEQQIAELFQTAAPQE